MILIKNGTIIDPSCKREEKGDLLIADGKIARIAPCGEIQEEGCEVIDATGMVVAPGLVDVHVHFRDPGFTYKEDIDTGAQAALQGGFTSVVLMANTKPVVDNEETLDYVLEKGKNTPIHVYSCASVSKGLQGKVLVDMALLYSKGASGFTDDGIPLLDVDILEQAFVKAASIGVPVSLHEEDPEFIGENGINAGSPAARELGITGSDRQAEISMIARDTRIAAELGVRLLIQHISTKEGVDLVRQARKINPLIHAEATPQHFSLTEDAVLQTGSLAKVNPPLRTEEDRLAIIQGLQDGTIDIIATDHAPHSAEEKAITPLWNAPSGMIGLETALSLALRHLVEPGLLSMTEMLALLTCNPADYYRLPAGTLAQGAAADIVIFDPSAKWTVTKESFHSKSCNSPFLGETLPGVIRCTISAGRIIYRNDR